MGAASGDGRQRPVGTVDAIRRDVVAFEICHIGELAPQWRRQQHKTDREPCENAKPWA
jgi:hypothetical protein